MSDLHNKLTQAEILQATKELFDKNAKTVFIGCMDHLYYPGKMGIENTALAPPIHTDCKSCWQAFYMIYFAKLPPHIRMERLDQFEAAAHHATEAESRGEFDFKPYRHPLVEITHEED